MDSRWTPDQIQALAPDAASLKAGRDLSSPRKWVSYGGNEAALWGLCQGSGKDPYQAQIDLSEPAFKCSCPSRKFPCKHALGLFLLAAANPAALTETEPPAWVTEWLSSRAQKAEQKAKQAEARASGTAPAPDPQAQAKRAADRERKVEAGVRELRLWLDDLVRRGLGDPQTHGYGFWDATAARLVDAQASGLARRLREMAGVPASGEGWQGRLLERLGRLHLLLEAYERLAELPAPLQAEVRTQIGWTTREEDLQDEPATADEWLVLGQRVEAEERLRMQRTWLVGRATGRRALVLDFAHGATPLDTRLAPGSVVDADIVFYPGAPALRASLREHRGSAELTPSTLPAQAITLARDAMAAYSRALGENPWLERYPLLLDRQVPVPAGAGWSVRDEAGHQLPLHPSFSRGWELLALSGGHPVTLFGEWNGESLLPLTIWAEGRFRSVSDRPS